jgi:hypothetical protein
MSSDTEEVHHAGAYFPHEQDVESAQRDGVQGEQVGGQQPRGVSAEESSPAGVCSAWCWAEAGSRQDSADRRGAQAVSSPASSPWMRRWPQDGFCCAKRSTKSRISSLTGGRPGRLG